MKVRRRRATIFWGTIFALYMALYVAVVFLIPPDVVNRLVNAARFGVALTLLVLFVPGAFMVFREWRTDAITRFSLGIVLTWLSGLGFAIRNWILITEGPVAPLTDKFFTVFVSMTMIAAGLCLIWAVQDEPSAPGLSRKAIFGFAGFVVIAAIVFFSHRYF